jgi:hypothetical protein
VVWGSPQCEAYYQPKVIAQIRDHTAWYLSLSARRIPRAVFNFSVLGIQSHPVISSDYNAWIEYFYGPGGWANNLGYITALASINTGIQKGTFWPMLWQHPSGVFYLGLVCFFAFIPPLLSIAAFILLRKKWRDLSLLAVVPVYYIVLHMFLMVASYKSIVPENIGYIVFCAVVIDWVLERLKRSTALPETGST